MKLFTQNTKYLVLLDQALFSGTNFALNILLAKALDIEAFGKFSALMLGAYLAISLSSSFIIQPAQTGLNKFKSSSYAKFLILFQLGILLFIFALCLIIPQVRFVESLFLVSFLGFDFFRKFFIAKGQIFKSIKVGFTLFISIIFSLSFIYFTNSFNLYNVFKALSISYFSSSFFAFFYFYKQAGGSINKEYYKYHLKHGKWLFTTSLAQWWSSNLLVVAAGLYLGYAALGALRLVQSVFGILNLLFQSFENYLIPSISRLIDTSPDAALKEIKSAMKLAYISYIPVLIIGLLFPSELLTIIGNSEFAQFDFLVQGFSILYLLIMLNQPLRLLIRSLELNQYFTLGYILLLLVNLSITDFVIRNYELMGIVIALSLSQILLHLTWGTLLINKKHALWKSYI